MNKARLLILGLALGSAAMAGILAKGVIGKKPTKEVVEVNRVPMVQVLVAAKDLALGERLDHSTINWRDSLSRHLLNVQKPDGSWLNDTGRWMENDPVLVTAYTLIALEHIHRVLR